MVEKFDAKRILSIKDVAWLPKTGLEYRLKFFLYEWTDLSLKYFKSELEVNNGDLSDINNSV